MNTPVVASFRTTGPDDTRTFAGELATLLEPGDVVSLTGELGAGKTCLVQGVARRLGVERQVTSPTFLLVKLYDEVAPRIVHVDVYRLERLQDVLDLGDDVMAPDAVTFIEWGDAVGQLLPPDRLELELTLADDELDADRVITARGHGAWGPRVERLVAAAGRWAEQETS